MESRYRTVARNLKLPVPERYIDWEDVDPVETSIASIKLRVPHQGLAELHPADLATIIDQLAPRDRAGVLASLDDEAAADAGAARDHGHPIDCARRRQRPYSPAADACPAARATADACASVFGGTRTSSSDVSMMFACPPMESRGMILALSASQFCCIACALV